MMTLSRYTLVTAMVVLGMPAMSAPSFVFDSADGGQIHSDDWSGRPVLVVNSASRCGFTPQYDEMQALFDTYGEQGLVVLAVPSDDFKQELSTIEEVKAYCELNFDLTVPMTDITHVKGPEAHPFYQWMAAEHGFVPQWNFNKVLIGADGEVKGTWGSLVKPDDAQITNLIEAEL